MMEDLESEPLRETAEVNSNTNGISIEEGISKTKSKFKFSELTKKKKLTFALCMLANLASGIGFSLIAPFYPKEAAKKGMSTTTIGLVFSSFELIMFLASLFFGSFGTLETALGVGTMIGPAVGGALYAAGGFGLPFFVMGSFMFLVGLLLWKLLPTPTEPENKETRSIFTLFRSGMVWVTLINIFNAALAITFIEPVLAQHLGKFHLSSFFIGLVFVISPSLYGFTAPVWGRLSDAKLNPLVLIIIGNVISCIGYLLIGPSPWLNFIPFELWVILVGLVLQGLSMGAACITTIRCLVIGATDLGLEDNLDTYGFVSGLYSAFFSAGSFLGPTLGSVLAEHIGFRNGSTLMAGCYLLVTLITFVFMVVTTLRQRNLEQTLRQNRKLSHSSSIQTGKVYGAVKRSLSIY